MAADIIADVDSRQKIVDSAKRMFWQHGYSTTSPRQVMADSGVSQGSFYHHFPTKPELGREVVEANGRDVLDAVQAAMHGLPTGRDRLAAFLGCASEALDGCRVGGFAYDAGILAEPELRESLESVFTKLEDLVEQAVQEGQSGWLAASWAGSEENRCCTCRRRGGCIRHRACHRTTKLRRRCDRRRAGVTCRRLIGCLPGHNVKLPACW